MADLFKLNFSEEDKTSTPFAGGFEPVPNGDYVCNITNTELKEVSKGGNAGKPYLRVELTVSEGDYENRKFWPNVMLFDVTGGNWFISQFLRATGNADALETGNIPLGSAFEGKEVTARVVRVKDKYKNEKDGPKPDGTPWYKNEVKGFVVDDEATEGVKPAGRKKRDTLLP